MALIVISGKERSYLLSHTRTDCKNLPDWGGIFIAIKAFDEHGLKIEQVMLVGMAVSLQKYQQRIQNRCKKYGATHLYILPEYKTDRRMEALEDILSQEPYNQAMWDPDLQRELGEMAPAFAHLQPVGAPKPTS